MDEVERLDRLAGGTLDQVVLDTDGKDPARPRVEADVDPDLVAARHVLGRRCRRDDGHERFVGIGRGIQLVEFGLGHRAGRSHVAGRQDAAGHRDEVGQEVDRDGAGVGAGVQTFTTGDECQFLFDLRHVAVATDAVRLHALVDLAEQEVRLGFAPGTRHAALRIHNEIADEPGAGQWGEREQGRGRVATRGPDDRDRRIHERSKLVAMELREAIDGLIEEVRARVLEAVPARVVGGVAQAEVGTLVDDRRAFRDEVGDQGGRRAMGEGHEDRVDRRKFRVDREVRGREVRVDTGDRVVITAAPHEADQLHVRVAGQQADQLGTDIAGRPDDPDPDTTWAPSRVQPAFRAGEETVGAVRGAVRRAWTDRMGQCHSRMTIQEHCIVMQSPEADRPPLGAATTIGRVRPPTPYGWLMMLPASLLALRSRLRGSGARARGPSWSHDLSVSRPSGGGDAGDRNVPRYGGRGGPRAARGWRICGMWPDYCRI